jgi:hypothetical protein
MDRLARIFGVQVKPRDDEEAAGQADPSPGDYDCPMPTAAEEEAMFEALEAERIRIEARAEEGYRRKEAMLQAALKEAERSRLETRAEELPRGCYRREEHNQGPDVVSAFPRMLGKRISDPEAFHKRAMFLAHYDARRYLADDQAADRH